MPSGSPPSHLFSVSLRQQAAGGPAGHSADLARHADPPGPFGGSDRPRQIGAPVTGSRPHLRRTRPSNCNRSWAAVFPSSTRRNGHDTARPRRHVHQHTQPGRVHDPADPAGDGVVVTGGTSRTSGRKAGGRHISVTADAVTEICRPAHFARTPALSLVTRYLPPLVSCGLGLLPTFRLTRGGGPFCSGRVFLN